MTIKLKKHEYREKDRYRVKLGIRKNLNYWTRPLRLIASKFQKGKK